MNKLEFLEQLRKALSGLPEDDIDERLTFYSEMIDDKIEDGISEETAVNEIGSIDEIVDQTIEDIPLSKLVKEKITLKKRLKVWEIVLLALGSPIWLSLIIAIIAIVISIYVALWSVIVALWAVFASLAACGLIGIIGGIYFAISSNGFTGLAIVAAGFTCAGLSIFMFFGCKEVTKVILKLTKKLAIHIKNYFIKREGD